MLTSLRLSSIFVLHSTLVVSFPKLILPRQEACEGWLCPKFDVLPFLDGVSDAVWGAGAAGSGRQRSRKVLQHQHSHRIR